MSNDQTQNQIEDRLLDQAANEYLAAISRGESPSLSEYANRYPAIATLIKSALPAIAMLKDSSKKKEDRLSIKLPEKLGDFRVLNKIGQGGMGVVYEAEQISVKRKVALKILPTTATLDATRLERFQLEVRVAATLDHPNCVPIYAVGEDQGVHYYAMKLIPGHTLSDVVQELNFLQKRVNTDNKTVSVKDLKKANVLQESASYIDCDQVEHTLLSDITRSLCPDTPEYFRKISSLGIQIAEALQHAHERGVVHRDIKPSNLILDSDGNTWITDFGLARLQQVDAKLTQTGETLGTPRYMAPEQMIGNSPTTSVDIYSIGVVLYELLVGQPPFQGESHAETIIKVQNEEPAPPSQIGRKIPPDLEAICLHCLEKTPQRRYRSAADLAADLKRFLAGEATEARPLSAIGVAKKWARRSPAIVSLIAISFLFVVAMFVGSVWYSAKLATAAKVAEKQRIEASRARTEAEQHLTVAEEQERIASGYKYAVQMRQAFYSWEAAELDEVENLLAEYNDGERWASHRGFEWYYLNRMLHTEIFSFQVDDPEVYDVAFSPDSKILAACGQKGWIKLWDLKKGNCCKKLQIILPV